MCPASESPQPIAEERRLVGPYEVIGPVHRGGMGVVHRARHTETGAIVALKTVRVTRGVDLSALRREIHALSRIGHPGVVPILAQGSTDDGLPWYAMELIEGHSLRQCIRAHFGASSEARDGTSSSSSSSPGGRARRRPASTERLASPSAATHVESPDPPVLDRAALLGIVAATCDPLAYIHGQGVVHRDVKPSNIVIRPNGAPVLVDFGLATRFGGAVGRESLEVGGLVVGSHRYMAPEQMRGQLLDARADLYALGCILYEILTGHRPFAEDNLPRLLSSHIRREPPPPSELSEDVSPEMDALVGRLLRTDPRERMGYALDVRRALDAMGYGAAPPSDTAPPTPATYVYRPGFAGRRDLLQTLDGQLMDAMRGRGGMVLLEGESGVGKTRLAQEVATAAVRWRLSVLTGECQALVPSQTTGALVSGPLHPFRSVLQAMADHCREHGKAEAERVFGERGPVLAPFEPSLATLPGQGERPAPSVLSAPAARRRVLDALEGSLYAFAATRHVLLVLDDLQWADDLTLAFLASLRRERLLGPGLLVLGTYRTDEESDALRELAERPWVTPLRLSPFAAPMVAVMVRDMLALDEAPTGLVRTLSDRSLGNPFFVAEYVRTAVAEGVLSRDAAGRWQVEAMERAARASIGEKTLPEAVRTLVGRRLAHLGAPARSLLDAAAVLGRIVEASLLGPTWCRAESEVLEAVSELVQKQFLEEMGEGRLRFVHDRIRETTYDLVDGAARRALHRSAALAIEAVHTGGEVPAARRVSLAHHWLRADEPSRALGYLEVAGEDALTGGAHRDALELLGRALGIVPLPDMTEAETTWRRARLLRMMADAWCGLGDLGRSAELGHEVLRTIGEDMAPGGGALTMGFGVELGRQIVRLTGAPVARTASTERQRALREGALAAARIAFRCYFANDALGMVSFILKAVNLAERVTLPVPLAGPYAQLGFLAGLSRLDRLSRAYFARAHAIAIDTNDLVGRANAFNLEAAMHIGFARWEQVREIATRGLEFGRAAGDPQELGTLLTALGHGEYYTGQLEASRDRFSTLHARAREQGNVQLEAWGLYAMARSLLAMDQPEAALPLLEEARALLETQEDHASNIICHGLLADAHVALGALEAAEAMAERTAELLGSSTPQVFSTVHGPVGAAGAYLALWARADAEKDPSAARHAHAARGMRDRLFRFARVFPMAAPAARRIAGAILVQDGRRSRGRRALRGSRALAIRMSMRHEARLAERALEALDG